MGIVEKDFKKDKWIRFELNHQRFNKGDIAEIVESFYTLEGLWLFLKSDCYRDIMLINIKDFSIIKSYDKGLIKEINELETIGYR